MILGVITLIAGVLLTTIPWLDYCILKVSRAPTNWVLWCIIRSFLCLTSYQTSWLVCEHAFVDALDGPGG